MPGAAVVEHLEQEKDETPGAENVDPSTAFA
jgi:hypothetical protein